MISDERFKKSWLAELHDIESFRRRYYSENRMAQLDREDPDVRRLLEALCFSAVRTRQVTLANLWSTWRRLLGSYFDFLLRPLPAMAIVQAVPTPRMTETAVIPKGTELRLTAQDGFVGTFTTLGELRLVPLTLDRCEVVPRGPAFRLVITLVSQFPRTDPAVIMRVTCGNRILMARQAMWAPGMHSVLAGFVEPGESLEDAVAREVFEEVGLRVHNIRYFGSQPWPFPASLMLGFTAESDSTAFDLHDGEIESAQWMTRMDLLNSPESDVFRLPRADSISRKLIEDWVRL